MLHREETEVEVDLPEVLARQGQSVVERGHTEGRKRSGGRSEVGWPDAASCSAETYWEHEQERKDAIRGS